MASSMRFNNTYKINLKLVCDKKYIQKMILNYNHPSDVSIGTFEAHLTATFENALSLLSRVICGDFVARGDTGMRGMDDFG